MTMPYYKTDEEVIEEFKEKDLSNTEEIIKFICRVRNDDRKIVIKIFEDSKFAEYTRANYIARLRNIIKKEMEKEYPHDGTEKEKIIAQALTDTRRRTCSDILALLDKEVKK